MQDIPHDYIIFLLSKSIDHKVLNFTEHIC